jgi:hypothetical protein
VAVQERKMQLGRKLCRQDLANVLKRYAGGGLGKGKQHNHISKKKAINKTILVYLSFAANGLCIEYQEKKRKK